MASKQQPSLYSKGYIVQLSSSAVVDVISRPKARFNLESGTSLNITELINNLHIRTIDLLVGTYHITQQCIYGWVPTRLFYQEKIDLVWGLDLYEIPKSQWVDSVDLWPTRIHVCTYLILTPSPYLKRDLLNYKSLDCYQNFVYGWVRDVMMKYIDGDKRIVLGKVNWYWASLL